MADFFVCRDCGEYLPDSVWNDDDICDDCLKRKTKPRPSMHPGNMRDDGSPSFYFRD